MDMGTSGAFLLCKNESMTLSMVLKKSDFYFALGPVPLPFLRVIIFCCIPCSSKTLLKFLIRSAKIDFTLAIEVTRRAQI